MVFRILYLVFGIGVNGIRDTKYQILNTKYYAFVANK
jgi:hypothetical protein